MTSIYDDFRELQEEVQRLQRALHFWLPGVPAIGPKDHFERIAHDAYLLTGWEPEGEVEKSAEEIGWIELRNSHPVRSAVPGDLGLPAQWEDDYCEPCGHHRRYHYEDLHGNVFCRWHGCECAHRVTHAVGSES